MSKLLLVEDNRSLSADVKQWLESENYSVETAFDGQSAIELLNTYSYDLVILDWELPGMTGIEILKQFRQKKGETPVIMLTGMSKLEEKETGLDSGADDYLTKPFQLRELSARLRSLLRRNHSLTENVLRLGDLVIEPQIKRASMNDREIALLPKEFAILELLARHPNEYFNGEALLSRVWSSESEASVNTVKSFMYTLRKKLTAAGLQEVIQTTPGFGYKAVSPKAG
jgi:DNA-binding response OmpR family regulator